MVGYFTALILFVIMIFTYYYDKRICNLITPFCGLWALITFLSSLGLYGMLDVNDIAYIIILVSVLSFVVGYYMLKDKHIIFSTKNKQSYETRIRTFKLAYNHIFAIQVFSTLFLLNLFSRALVYLLQDNGWNTVRDMYQGYNGDSLFFTSIEKMINDVLVSPFMFVTICILTVMIFEKEIKKHKLVFFLGWIDLLLYMLMSAGRLFVVTIILFIILGMSIYSIQIKFSKKKKRKITILIIVCIIITLTLTSLRKSSIEEWDTIHQIYSYFAITPSILGNWVDYINFNGINTYGMGFLNGIFSVFNIFYGRLGIEIPLKTLTEAIIQATETFIPVFANKNYNAFVSAFFYFYLDFRWIGVILGGLFIGIVSAQSYLCIKKNRNVYNVMIFLLWSFCLFKTMTRWEPLSPVCILSFIYLRVFVKSVRISKII